MTKRRVWNGWLGSLSVAVAVSAFCAGQMSAQQWSWPERPENLQQLPADFPPERLSAVMRGFTNALGVRCSYCHVGEEGQPLGTYDFASDDNPMKVTARAMLGLLGDVNERLGEIEPSGERVNMWCHTCHNGKPRPQTLEEALMERDQAEGAGAAIDYFVELRERYYGGPQYDFRPGTVGQLAAALLQRGDTTPSGRLFRITLENHPDSWEAHEGLGDFLSATGDTEGAIERYERALELSPENPRVAAKLARIR